MKYRVVMMSEDGSTTTLIVFAPIEPDTIIQYGTDSSFNVIEWRVLTCTAVPDYFN